MQNIGFLCGCGVKGALLRRHSVPLLTQLKTKVSFLEFFLPESKKIIEIPFFVGQLLSIARSDHIGHRHCRPMLFGHDHNLLPLIHFPFKGIKALQCFGRKIAIEDAGDLGFRLLHNAWILTPMHLSAEKIVQDCLAEFDLATGNLEHNIAAHQ